MKKGFTLIELLAVIVILAIIALIATPIVLNIISDSKDNANKRSIDMYAKAVENAVARYQLNKGDVPDSYEEVKDYIEYSGSEVVCDDFRIYSDGTAYLNYCTVDGKYIDYSKGNVIGPGTIAYSILSNYGGSEGIKTLSTKWVNNQPWEDNISMGKTGEYYWGTEMDFNETNGKYKLGGTIVKATVEECRNGEKSDGTAITCSYFDDCGYDCELGYIRKVTSLYNNDSNYSDWNDGYTDYTYITVLNYGSSNLFSNGTTETDAGLYKAQDDLGDSYYFRGNPTNNYVKFGTYAEDTVLTVYDYKQGTKTVEVAAGTPMYWRIVRINGDGSIRLIYDGTEKVENNVSHEATIGVTVYDSGYGDTKYAGYTYDDGNGNQVDSKIKGVVDTWYEQYLKTDYETYIADSIFCNDRSGATTSEYSGDVYYASYYRLFENNKAPILTCANKEDRYTKDDTRNGNGLLTNPVGLLTADEALMAGGNVNSGLNKSYLSCNGNAWTSTSAYFYDGGGRYSINRIWYFSSGAYVGWEDSDEKKGVRPVINLKAGVKFEGNGTITSPYEIVIE